VLAQAICPVVDLVIRLFCISTSRDKMEKSSMSNDPISEKEQLDAALDAALDELDDDDDSTEDISPPVGISSASKTASPRLPVMGPPRPPIPDDPQQTLDDIMQQLMSQSPPSTGDTESDAFLGQMMQQMQSQLQSEMGTTRPTPKKESKKPASPKSDVDKAVSQLVKDMAKPDKVDQDDDDDIGDEDVLKSFMEELNLNDGSFNPDNMVEGMMQELLSKELMYEPMKQVAAKFPDWLKERRGTLSKDEYDK
jgi:peroxin-19